MPRPSSLRVSPRGVKSDEIPTLWEETSAQRSSSPRQVRNWKRGTPSGRNRWRLASTSNKMVGNRLARPTGKSYARGPCEAATKRLHLFELFPDDRKTGSRHLTVNEGNSRPSWNAMVHYPNWQRETAQTRSSFGSNPK